MAKNKLILTEQGRGISWSCKCGAVLGVVPLDEVPSKRVLLFRHAQKPDPRNIYLERIAVELRGAGVVQCSLCGRKRGWREL